MVLVLILIFSFLILSIIFLIFLSKKKKSCSCIGLKCGSVNDCGEQCCNSLQNQKCVNGVCCSTDCTGKSCGEKNGCGEECNNCVGGKCYNGQCCYPQCSQPCQPDGCGGICPCDNGQVCVNGECCEPDECSTGVCGIEKCGQTCTCNDNYCPGEGCCKDNMCTYDDICNVKKSVFMDFFKNSWGRFCQPSTSNPLIPQCSGCSLVLPTFDNNSIAPVSGTIVCDSCEIDGQNINHNVTPVIIEKDVQYYYNDNGEISKGPINPNYCANQEGGCQNCICLSDGDCTRWGCTKCVGQKCQ